MYAAALRDSDSPEFRAKYGIAEDERLGNTLYDVWRRPGIKPKMLSQKDTAALLEMDEPLTEALRQMDTNRFTRLAGSRKGYRPLLHCALDYATAGITSIDEVVRLAGGLDELQDSAMDNLITPGETEP